MDPISQTALGAVVGHVAGHRRLGAKAAVIGAVAGALPDIDVLFSVGGDYFDQLVLHRGITHSLFFAPVAGPALGWLVWYRERRRNAAKALESPWPWIWVITLALLSHPLLDLLTPYGTQLLLPFSDQRFAINAMPIIDPIYTAMLLLGLLAVRLRPNAAVPLAWATLLTSSSYLGYGWSLNERARLLAQASLAELGVEHVQLAAFPTVLQVHYRRLAARTEDTDRLAYVSLWRPCEIVWQAAPRGDAETVAAFLDSEDGRIFSWFTMGWAHYHGVRTGGGLVVHATDLRYGTSTDPRASFFAATLTRQPDGGQQIAVNRNVPSSDELSLAKLFDDSYPTEC